MGKGEMAFAKLLSVGVLRGERVGRITLNPKREMIDKIKILLKDLIPVIVIWVLWGLVVIYLF